MEDVHKYELSLFPPTLFEANYVLQKPEKTQLARAIEEYASVQCDVASEQCDKAVSNDIPKTDNYVLDGGSLVQCVPWTKGNTYGAITNSYVDFTFRNCRTATVVFNGYQEIPSTKDNSR